jgi:hypothetical protein
MQKSVSVSKEQIRKFTRRLYDAAGIVEVVAQGASTTRLEPASIDGALSSAATAIRNVAEDFDDLDLEYEAEVASQPSSLATAEKETALLFDVHRHIEQAAAIAELMGRAGDHAGELTENALPDAAAAILNLLSRATAALSDARRGKTSSENDLG